MAQRPDDFIFVHSNRDITDEEALRVKKSGGYVSPTFTEWMMDGIWPEDITPQQAADMIDYYVKLIGVDHVGIASLYDDGRYMLDAFDGGATGCGGLSKILAAVTDELWKRGYSNEDLAKIYGGNKMRVYREVWERSAPEGDPIDPRERRQIIEDLRKQFYSR